MLLGTLCLLMPFTLARCMRITSRNGSRLMYQPGQAPPGMVAGALATLVGRTNASVPTRAPRFVSDRFLRVGSVAGTSGSPFLGMRLDCKYASPHIIAVTQAA